MGRIWSDQNKFYSSGWSVELAASEALAELGVVPREAAELLRRHAGFTVSRIFEIEKEVKHDVIAFTTAVAGKAWLRPGTLKLRVGCIMASLQTTWWTPPRPCN